MKHSNGRDSRYSALLGSILLTAFSGLFSIGWAEPLKRAPRVVHIYPDIGEPSSFQRVAIAFAETVANDIGLIYDVRPAPLDPSLYSKTIDDILSEPDAPDYLLASNYRGTAPRTIKCVESAGVDLFLVGTGLKPALLQRGGGPRVRSERWIGEWVVDHERAGYKLAQQLIALARQAGATDVNVLALSGTHKSHTSKIRSAGLRRALEEDPDSHLAQEVNARLQSDVAALKTPHLLARHRMTNAIWSATDSMAIGAADAAHGQDLVIGGIGWTPRALEAIESGTLHVSLGGHFTMVGWALVLLYDHHNGFDFADGPSGTSRRAVLQPVSREGVSVVRDILDPAIWSSLNFTAFTKTHNPGRAEYDFSLEALLEEIRAAG